MKTITTAAAAALLVASAGWAEEDAAAPVEAETTAETAAEPALEGENGWRGAAYMAQFYAEKGVDPNKAVGDILYFNDGQQPGVMFSCREGKLGVTLGLEPGDLVEAIDDGLDKARLRRMVLTVGDTSYRDNRWVYAPIEEVMTATVSRSAVRVYNGVLRGDTITLKMQGKAAIDINAPAPDDVFVEFTRSCNL